MIVMKKLTIEGKLKYAREHISDMPFRESYFKAIVSDDFHET